MSQVGHGDIAFEVKSRNGVIILEVDEYVVAVEYEWGATSMEVQGLVVVGWASRALGTRESSRLEDARNKGVTGLVTR